MLRDVRVERVASHRSGQRMTEITSKNLLRLQKLSCSRSWHQSIVGLSSGNRLHKGDTAWEKQNLVGQVRDEPRAHRGDQEWCNGARNPKTGAAETLRNVTVARDTRSTLGPGTKRTFVVGDARYIRHLHRPAASPRRPDRLGRSSDSTSSSSSSDTGLFEFMLRPIPEGNSRKRCGRSDSESSCQVVHTDQESS